jgi:type I restriction enzyme M protein
VKYHIDHVSIITKAENYDFPALASTASDTVFVGLFLLCAEVTAGAVYLALHGRSMQEIRQYTERKYPIDFTIDSIRDTYEFDASCQGTVPQALECFYESKDFEDAIRIAVSLGGDSDTIAAITGSIAEAYYGIPNSLRIQAAGCLDTELLRIVNHFEEKYPSKTL